MDISSLTKAGTVSPAVVKTAGDTASSPSTAVKGNSLPDEGQARVRVETPLNVTSLNETPTPPASSEDLNILVEQANVTLQGRSSELKFTVAEGTDISVVRIEDSKTGELIRQVPSEAMVAIARAIDEAQQGMMLKEKA